MAKLDDTGVYQLKGGNWAYRYTITENGRKKDVRKAKDDDGNPFNTKREAIKARLIAIGREQEGNKPKPKDRKTIAEVYAEYCESGRESKAWQMRERWHPDRSWGGVPSESSEPYTGEYPEFPPS